MIKLFWHSFTHYNYIPHNYVPLYLQFELLGNFNYHLQFWTAGEIVIVCVQIKIVLLKTDGKKASILMNAQ